MKKREINKYIIILLLIIIILVGFTLMKSQSNKSKTASSEKPVIFQEDYDISYLTKEKRYTPSNEDVEAAEEILSNYIKTTNKKIYSKLPEYERQYFGLLNKNNEKIIFINAGNKLNSFNSEYWKKEYVMVFDGGDDFFNIKINLNTKSCFDFSVNGEA